MIFNVLVALLVQQTLAQETCNGTEDLAFLQGRAKGHVLGHPLAQVGCKTQQAAMAELRAELAISRTSTGFVGPMFIRGVFHDALDANNLQDKVKGKWQKRASKPLDGGKGWSYGGVDGCMYSTLATGGRGAQHCEDGESEDSGPCPDSQHNRNIAPAMSIAETVCTKLGLQPLGDCMVDMFVLGAIVAIQDAGGPVIPMLWGRRQGPCEEMTCSQNTCRDATAALDVGLPQFDLDNLEVFGQRWTDLGFNETEQVALMGAHTFGKANVCAGGLNGVMRGHWCPKEKKLEPPLTNANMGSCQLQIGTPTGCWEKDANAKSPAEKTYVPKLHPIYPIYGDYLEGKKDELLANGMEMLNSDMGKGVGFGDGAIWDQTPEVFDNNYFELMRHESADQKDVCCGPVGDYGQRMFRKAGTKGKVCLELGDEKKSKSKKQSSRVGMHNRKTGERINPNDDDDICGARWCRYGDKKGRGHMKSPTLWHEADYQLVKKPWKWGAFKRIIRLAGDWALLLPSTRPYVEEFADDQDAFFRHFAAAFEKVAKRGYAEGDLATCVSV